MENLEPIKDFAGDVYNWMIAAAAAVSGWYLYVKATYSELTKDWSDKATRRFAVLIGLAAFVLLFVIIYALRH